MFIHRGHMGTIKSVTKCMHNCITVQIYTVKTFKMSKYHLQQNTFTDKAKQPETYIFNHFTSKSLTKFRNLTPFAF